MSNSPHYFVHESAYVDEPCIVGKDTKIWHFSHIMRDSVIGERCNIGQNVVVSPGCRIGHNVKIQNNVSVYTGVILHDDVFCGPSSVFTNVLNPRSHISRRDEYRETVVMRGASIGANATIVCGHTLGQYSFVGAGSVVTRDVPNFAMVMGNPARIRGWLCYCGIRLGLSASVSGSEEATCPACSRRYTRNGTQVDMIESERRYVEC
jgi:UDP-2-acetamido-3-amino-2,3-dideoxy-glucuronate N-acetyltransferase